MPRRRAKSTGGFDSFQKFFGVHPWLKFFAPPRICFETYQRWNRDLIERKDGFGYQALTEFAEDFL